MADSELLKTFLALNDDELGQRIQGAMVKYADYLAGVGEDPLAVEFARRVLADPLLLWPRMRVKVVYNGSVMEALKIGRHGEVETYFVKDSDITYVVESSWLDVAQEQGIVVAEAITE